MKHTFLHSLQSHPGRYSTFPFRAAAVDYRNLTNFLEKFSYSACQEIPCIRGARRFTNLTTEVRHWTVSSLLNPVLNSTTYFFKQHYLNNNHIYIIISEVRLYN